MTKSYDVIVIGNDLSSLVATELVSRSGKKTLLIKEGKVPDVYSESGYTFNLDTSIPAGLGTLDTVVHPYLENDLYQMNRAALKMLNPGLQIITPSHRVDVGREREGLIRDIEREFPGSSSRMNELYDAAETTALVFSRFTLENPFLCIPWRSLKTMTRFLKAFIPLRREHLKFVRRLEGLDDTLICLLDAQASGLSDRVHRCGDGYLTPATPYFLNLPLKGLFYCAGGKHLIAESLTERFLRQGAECTSGCEIAGIDVDDGYCRVAWAAEGSVGESLGERLIVSSKWKKLCDCLLNNRKGRRFSQRLNRRRTKAFYPFTVHMGVFDKGIPERLAEYAVILCKETGEFRIQEVIFLELSQRGDTGRAPEGRRALSATRYIEEPPERLGDEDLRRVAADLLGDLEVFFPFLRENVDYLDTEKCLTLSRSCGELTGCKIPAERNILSVLDCLPNRTPFENVFLTGDELLGMGFIGEVLSGINAASLAGASPAAGGRDGKRNDD